MQSQQQQYTGAQLYELCYRRGNLLYVDGHPTPSKHLQRDKCLYYFVREQYRSAAVREIYVVTGCIQQTLF